MTEPVVNSLPALALPAFTIAGYAIRTTNAEAQTTIPALWIRVHAEALAQTISGACALAGHDGYDEYDGPDVPFVAVYTDYESDHNGAYTLLVGVPVVDAKAANAAKARGLDVREIPGRTRAHLEAHGEPIPAVMKAWSHVWQTMTPERSFTDDLEVYVPSRMKKQIVDVYIATR